MVQAPSSLFQVVSRFSTCLNIHITLHILHLYNSRRQDIPLPYKAENWRALPFEQYFLPLHFLDVCPWVFKLCRILYKSLANTSKNLKNHIKSHITYHPL